MNMGRTIFVVSLAMIVVFISAFVLFFVIDRINKIAEKCKLGLEPEKICNSFTGFTMNMVIVLLIISGFILTISSTVFILIR